MFFRNLRDRLGQHPETFLVSVALLLVAAASAGAIVLGGRGDSENQPRAQVAGVAPDRPEERAIEEDFAPTEHRKRRRTRTEAQAPAVELAPETVPQDTTPAPPADEPEKRATPVKPRKRHVRRKRVDPVPEPLPVPAPPPEPKRERHRRERPQPPPQEQPAPPTEEDPPPPPEDPPECQPQPPDDEQPPEDDQPGDGGSGPGDGSGSGEGPRDCDGR